MTRRCFAAILLSAGLLFVCTSIHAQARPLPESSDDLAFAERLMQKGFPDLAIDIYERQAAKPGLTPLQKQQIDMAIVDAYRRLAAAATDEKSRNAYLAKAKEKIEAMGPRATTPALNYEAAKISQQMGRQIAEQVSREQDPERKEALREQGAQKFDEAATALEQARKEGVEIIRTASEKDPSGYRDKTNDVRVVVIQSELQLCWTAYFKALLYDKGTPNYTTSMSQAVQLFGGFIEKYPDDMGMLLARYGRGLAYRLLDKLAEAQADFGTVVKMIEDAGVQHPQVLAVKARCRIKWAEVSGELGEFKEAHAGLDKMFAENDVLKTDKELIAQGTITKAKVHAMQGAAAKKGGNRDDVTNYYKEAIETLKPVSEGDTPYAFEAKTLIATYIEAGDLKVLSTSERLALAEQQLRDGKYAEAIPNLRKVVDSTDAKLASEDRMHAQRMLAQALIFDKQYEQAIKEFASILRLYPAMPKAERAKILMQTAWAVQQYMQARPEKTAELSRQYQQTLEDLAKDYADTPEGREAAYYLAESLRENANAPETFLKAAEEYAKVSADSARYDRSRYLQGLCLFNVYKQYESRGQAADAKAKEALVRAGDVLKKVVDDVMKAEVPRENWHLEAAGLLADVYLASGRNEDAEGVLALIDQMKTGEGGGSAKTLETRIGVYLRLGRLRDAHTTFEELAKRKDATPAMLFAAALQVADAYDAKISALKKEEKFAEADETAKSASGLLKSALVHVDEGAADKGKGAKLIAERAYEMKAYDLCIEAIDKVEGFYKAENREADDPLWNLRIIKVKCYEATMQWPPEALELLKTIEQHPKHGQYLEIKMLRGSVLESRREFDEALKIWNTLAAGLEPGSKNWWEVQHRRARCYLLKGDKAKALEAVTTLEILNPDMGGPEMKAKFEDLKKQCQ